MPEEISNPLLTLIREQGLVDDLQYEGVAAEIKRSNASVVQVLQDFGIMKLDDILHIEANYLGTEVVSLKDREISPELLKIVPATVARMYRCLP
ncbi:MAG TPA: pilus assembly protein PilB, partial [Verrucomicrobiae bacterium]